MINFFEQIVQCDEFKRNYTDLRRLLCIKVPNFYLRDLQLILMKN
jgi:hypothetical protein